MSAVGVAWVFTALGIIAAAILLLRRVFQEKPRRRVEMSLSEEEAAAVAAVVSTFLSREVEAAEVHEARFEGVEQRPWQVAGRIESTLRRPAGGWK